MASNFKRKRNVLDIEILKCLVKGKSEASLAKFYNFGKSTISNIKKAENHFKIFHLEEGYSRDDVYSADDGGVNWKALPRKSLTSKQKSTAPSFKVSNVTHQRVTAMVCANANGSHTLPLLVIDKNEESSLL
ncbi:UNVERIFIED_CONTAM: Jrkl [Trichonephila clavipes]